MLGRDDTHRSAFSCFVVDEGRGWLNVRLAMEVNYLLQSAAEAIDDGLVVVVHITTALADSPVEFTN